MPEPVLRLAVCFLYYWWRFSQSPNMNGRDCWNTMQPTNLLAQSNHPLPLAAWLAWQGAANSLCAASCRHSVGQCSAGGTSQSAGFHRNVNLLLPLAPALRPQHLHNSLLFPP